MVVFIHGAGRRGREAWSTIQRSDGRFLELPDEPLGQQAARVVEAVGEGASIVAHSYGGLVAAVALRELGERVHRLVLVEPALYDVARGIAAVEHHVAAMETARSAFDEGGLEAYWRVVRPLMFGGEFAPDLWETERPTAARLHELPVPWGHGVSAIEFATTPTVVVTGGWNDEYEAIAAALVVEGAQHHVLTGAGHRPQDLDAFNPLLDEFLGGPSKVR